MLYVIWAVSRILRYIHSYFWNAENFISNKLLKDLRSYGKMPYPFQPVNLPADYRCTSNLALDKLRGTSVTQTRRITQRNSHQIANLGIRELNNWLLFSATKCGRGSVCRKIQHLELYYLFKLFFLKLNLSVIKSMSIFQSSSNETILQYLTVLIILKQSILF